MVYSTHTVYVFVPSVAARVVRAPCANDRRQITTPVINLIPITLTMQQPRLKFWVVREPLVPLLCRLLSGALARTICR